MEEYKISSTLKELVRFMDQSVEIVWQFVKRNYGMLLIIITLLGGLIQFARLLFISPAATPYYSAKQGIIDGLLFIIFLSCIIGMATFLFISYVHLATKCSRGLRIFLGITTIVINITIVYLLYNIELLWFGLFISMILLAHSMIFFSPGFDTIDRKDLNDDKNWLLTHPKITTAYFITMTLFVGLGGYYDLSKELGRITSRNLVNYKTLETKLNNLGYRNFKVAYSNGEHLFLTDEKRRCLVVDISLVTKEIFEPQQTVKPK
ncbi:hypothetical protein [Kaistella sp.]|uniref:hypothetical protein n=1 Tax=Kaistella sp. TaxID=2782235 RepID=UPI002F94D52C